MSRSCVSAVPKRRRTKSRPISASPDEIHAAGQDLADERDGGAVPGAEGVAGDEGRDLARQADGGEHGGEQQEHRRAANAALRDQMLPAWICAEAAPSSGRLKATAIIAACHQARV